MSRFFKRMITKEKQGNPDSITNYLISEIEDIVSKKIYSKNIYDSMKNNKDNYIYKKSNHKELWDDNVYTSQVNYNLKEEQPFKALKYVDEGSQKTFLPFEEKDMKPQVYNEDQIRSIVKKTLKPALNQWLDENLDIIIEKAIKKNYDKYFIRPRRRTTQYYED